METDGMDAQKTTSPWRRSAMLFGVVAAFFGGSAHAQLENTADVLASGIRTSSSVVVADDYLHVPQLRTLNGQPFLSLDRWDAGVWKKTPYIADIQLQGYEVALFGSDRVPGLYVSTRNSTRRVLGGEVAFVLTGSPFIADAVTTGGVAKLLVIGGAQEARWAGAAIDAPVSSEARRVRHAAASDDGRVFAVSDLDGDGPGTDHGVFVTDGGAWQRLPGLTVLAEDVDVTSIAWDSSGARVVVAGRGLRVDGRPTAAQLAVATGGTWTAWDGGWSGDRRVLARRLQDGAVYLVDRSDSSRRPEAVLRIEGSRLVPAVSGPPELAWSSDIRAPLGMAADASGLVLDTTRGLMRFPRQGSPQLLGLRVSGLTGDYLLAHGPSDRVYLVGEVEELEFRSDSGAYRQGGRWVALPPLPTSGDYSIRKLAPSDGALVVTSRTSDGLVWRFRDAWEALPPLADPPGTIDQLAVGPNDEVVLVGDRRAVEYANGQWRPIESPAPIHFVAWSVGAEPRLHAIRTDTATGLRHIDVRNGVAWSRLAYPAPGPVTAFEFDASGTLIAVSRSFGASQEPTALWWRNGAWERLLSAVNLPGSQLVRTAAGVVLSGWRGPWVMGACSGYSTTVYNATGISPPPSPTIAAAVGGRHVYWLDGSGLRRWAISAPPGGAIKIPESAGSSVDVELDGPPSAIFPEARICSPATPTEMRIKLTGGSPVAGDELLLLRPQPLIDARFDSLTRTLQIRARPGMSPSLSDWDVALSHVQVAARASTYRNYRTGWSARAEVDVPGSAVFGFGRALYSKSAPPALRLVAPREVVAIAGVAQRLTGVRIEGSLPSGQRIELSASAMSPGLVAGEASGVVVERIGTTGVRATAERELLQAWLDAGHLQFQAPGVLAPDVDVALSVRSGSSRADARTTLRYGGAAPLAARPDHLRVPRGSTDIALRVLDNDVFAAADLAPQPITILSGLAGLNAWVDAGDTATPVDDVIRLRLESGLMATRTFNYQLCSRSTCSTASVRLVPALSDQETVRVEATVDRGERSVEFSAFEPIAALRFDPTSWVVPTAEVVALEGGRPGDPILATPGPSRVLRSQVIPASSIDRTVRISVEVAGTDAEIALMAGAGETPGESSAQCVRSAFAQSQVCELEILQRAGAPLTWWWFAQNLSATSVPLRAETAVAIAPIGAGGNAVQPITVTGPSILPWAMRPTLRLAWDVPTLIRGERHVAWVRAANSSDQALGWQRVELLGAASGVAKADRVLVPGRERRMRMDRGPLGIFVDVPSGASLLQVQLTSADLAAGALRLEGEGELWSFQPPDAAGRSTVTVQAPKAGRYWVRYVHAGAPTDVLARADVVANAPRLAPGGLFDPRRPGAGLFVHPAGGDWAGVLYAYDANGLPTWYYLQAPAPDEAGQWSTVVYRSQWAEGRNRLVPVGDALLSAVTSDRALLSLTIGDRHWRQTLEGFGGGCPSIGGTLRNLSGHWFDPSRAGSGYSVQLFPNYEFYALYLYDGLGQPRFVVAEHPRAGGILQSMPVEQVEREDRCEGDCPPVTAGPRTRVGTLSRVIGPSGFERFDIDVTFDSRPGLSGVWRVEDRPVPLGSVQGCAMP